MNAHSLFVKKPRALRHFFSTLIAKYSIPCGRSLKCFIALLREYEAFFFFRETRSDLHQGKKHMALIRVGDSTQYDSIYVIH